MKNPIIIAAFMLLFAGSAIAQTKITCSANKQIERNDGVWEDWPTTWSSYDSAASKPVIQITELNRGTYGDIYRLQFFIDDEERSDFNVVYDEDETATIRSSWGRQNVYCYKEEGSEDYIYTSGVSLTELAVDSSPWRTNEDSKIYMWINSEDFAVVVK